MWRSKLLEQQGQLEFDIFLSLKRNVIKTQFLLIKTRLDEVKILLFKLKK